MKITKESFINSYDAISEYCNETGEPVYIDDELVTMSIEAYEDRQHLLDLKERQLAIEIARFNGANDYSLEELDKALKKAINLN